MNTLWLNERIEVPSSIEGPVLVSAGNLSGFEFGPGSLDPYEQFRQLRPTAVIEAFQAWSGRSGLAIPFKGAHCIRHSFAVNLLRRGTPLKIIGDLMGHRSPESTAVYLRLATEDLRGVALPLPTPVPVIEKERA